MFDPYIRSARLHRVVDADTYEMIVSLGYRVEGRYMIRVRGLFLAELNTPEGVIAKAKAERILTQPDAVIIVRSCKDAQSFARWIADVFVNGESMIDLMARPE